MTRDDETECFDPGFLTICHHTILALPIGMSASVAAVAPQLRSSRHARAVAVMFSFDQHGPDDPGGFGGEGHHGDLVRPPRQQIAQPWIGDAARLLLSQMGAGSADQQCSQYAISLFGDVPRAMLAAGAVVFTGQPNPGREVAAGAEHLRIRHLGQYRAGNHGADAWSFHQPPGVLIAAGCLGDLPFKHTFVDIERLPVPGQYQQRAPHVLGDVCAGSLVINSRNPSYPCGATIPSSLSAARNAFAAIVRCRTNSDRTP